MLQPGNPFPEFALADETGAVRRKSEFAGRWLVVYFYPKDDTPGCTIQGRSFTAARSEFQRAGITVLGVSQDDVASHKSFCDKYSLAVTLLSDPEATLMRACGIGQTDYKGTAYWDRTTFVVDPEGIVRKVYAKVDPNGHEQVLLKDIAALRGAPARTE
jgi:peroxiredoxin Q/BCP